MRCFKMVFVFTIFTFLLGAPVFGAEIAKIGVFDLQKIIRLSSQGKASGAEIKKKGEQIKAEFEKKKAQLNTLKKQLENEGVMDPAARADKLREFRILKNDFKTFEKRSTADFQKLNQEHMSRLTRNTFAIAREMGKKDGFLLILELNEAGVVYAPSSIDITDKVIQKLNADYASGKSKSKKK